MTDIFKRKRKTIKVRYLPKEWTLGYRPPTKKPLKRGTVTPYKSQWLSTGERNREISPIEDKRRKKMEGEKKQVTQPAQVQIEIDEQTAQGVYANLAMITHNETEFVFDFIYLQPQAPKAKVRARIITSPLHAKRFLKALEDNLKKYEAHFGQLPEIKEVEKPIAFA